MVKRCIRGCACVINDRHRNELYYAGGKVRLRSHVLLAVAITSLGIVIGYSLARYRLGVRTYRGYQSDLRIAFHRDQVTYGLPIAEYTLCLRLLDAGSTNRLHAYLDSFLDAAIHDAQCRRETLRGDELLILDRALEMGTEYRNAE